MGNLIRISEPASLALHAAALLARQTDGRIANQEIAAALQVSGHHLAKVMQQLVRAGIVQSTRGPHGGFTLALAPEDITLLQLFEAVEGPLGDAECLLRQQVCDGADCLVGELVHAVHSHVRQYLADTTLARLAKRFTLVSL
ncbi:MAG: Rrf2 family transcriptional regulator [Planctomycetaceae bacterium]|nr:Rrf2 family transcriptional regulator [Planctomycetaceae bacterium]